MRLASWNVNSLNVRMPRVLEFLADRGPDVLCLQETKARTEAFPHLELQMAGYTAIDHCSGGRNGVALLVRDGLAVTDVATGLPGEPHPEEARWVQARVDGTTVASVYVPNGQSPDSPAFAGKLAFLRAMVDHVAGSPEPVIVAGDLNIAPSDLDVYDPVRYVGTTHTSARERAFLAELADKGYVDAFRLLHPDEQRFTWWDYRGGNFHKNLGMRIDLFLTPREMLSEQATYEMARDYRKGTKPSDHAPIVLTTE